MLKRAPVLLRLVVFLLAATTGGAGLLVVSSRPAASPESGVAVSAPSPHAAGRLSSETAAPENRPPAASRAGMTPPSFHARILEIDAGIKRRMGTSWQPGCPVPLRDLRLIETTFWGFDGLVHTGELIVHRRYGGDIAGVFRKLFEARFPIERMVLANGYMGNEPPLALPNNTAGFNCRRSIGSGAWSEHAYGRAIDINPVRNPYVDGDRVAPTAGEAYVDRRPLRKGMVNRAVRDAFTAIGWSWGGLWKDPVDYQHFSSTGR